MKRILFDQQIFRKQNFGGISRYFTALITGLGKKPGYQVLPKTLYTDNVYLAEHHLTSFNRIRKARNFSIKNTIERLILKAENYQVAKAIKKGAFEVFHPTYYNADFLKYIPQNKPFVITIHDMIHERYYDNMLEYLTEETKHKMLLIPRASHIIAVSHYTKNEILKYFPQINPDKITVIYHGVSLQPTINPKKHASLPAGYLLFVGTKKHYKNFFWMVEALGGYLAKNNLVLVCAGGADFDTYENNFIAGLNLKPYIKYVPINTDEDMAAIYKNAACFIFPSLIEGFGMPILESFVCECPAVLANSSCFPEIAADAALYFEPGNKTDLVEKIDAIRQDETLKNKLVKKGINRARLFNWETAVDQHLKIYNSLVAN
jgi:glycosyltransferase involved in cell wall biosynthesis